MPMNKFLFDHQLAAMKVGSRAKRMADWRKANGLSNAGWPQDERPELVEKDI